MRITYKTSVVPMILAAALVSGCDSDPEELVQPFVDAATNPPVTDTPAPEPTPVLTPTPVEPTPVVDDDPPADPVVPAEPVEPVTPVEPVAPVEPVEPVLPEIIDPTGIIASVSIGDVEGIFYAGKPPEAIGSIVLSPLTVNAEPIQFISGGSTQVPVEADQPFITTYVVSDDEGYFQLDLPEEVSTADLIVTFSEIQLDGELSNIAIQVQNAVGDISGAQNLPVSSVVVGTGELQVSVSWDTPTDVDIFLIEPDGTVIFWNAPVSSSGGSLDLDSNPACLIDGVNNENITYENVTPPTGEYIVGLNYYSACGLDVTTSFVVTVRSGGQVDTYPGNFVLTDDNATPTEISRFEVR